MRILFADALPGGCRQMIAFSSPTEAILLLCAAMWEFRGTVVRAPEGATKSTTAGCGRLGTRDFRATSGVRGSPCRSFIEVLLREASRQRRTPLFPGLFGMR